MSLEGCTPSACATPQPPAPGSAASTAGICLGDKRNRNNLSKEFILSPWFRSVLCTHQGFPIHRHLAWPLETEDIRSLHLASPDPRCESYADVYSDFQALAIVCLFPVINCVFESFVLLSSMSLIQQLNPVEVPLLVQLHVQFLCVPWALGKKVCLSSMHASFQEAIK